MKRFLLTVFIGVLLGSCTIVYEGTFEEDNSGTMEVMVDMQEFISKMGDGKIPEKTQKKIDSLNYGSNSPDSMTIAEYVEMADGVSGAKFFQKDSSFIIGLRFDFETPEALNEAMNRIEHFNERKEDSLAVLKSFEYYKFAGNRLTIKEPIEEQKEGEEEEMNAKMVNAVTQMLSYEWRLTFAGKKIKKVDSPYEYEVEHNNRVVITATTTVIKDRTKEKIATIEFK